MSPLSSSTAALRVTPLRDARHCMDSVHPGTRLRDIRTPLPASSGLLGLSLRLKAHAPTSATRHHAKTQSA